MIKKHITKIIVGVLVASVLFFAVKVLADVDAIGGTEILFPTPGETMDIAIGDGVKATMAIWEVGEDEVVSIVGTHKANQMLVIEIQNEIGQAQAVSLLTGFLHTGDIVIAPNKTAMLSFISDGTHFVELTRNVSFQLVGGEELFALPIDPGEGDVIDMMK